MGMRWAHTHARHIDRHRAARSQGGDNCCMRGWVLIHGARGHASPLPAHTENESIHTRPTIVSRSSTKPLDTKAHMTVHEFLWSHERER